MLEPAYRATDDVIAVSKETGVSFVLARKGEFLSAETVEEYELDKPALRTADATPRRRR